jgi:NADH-quinone oxidoreductase subunit G
MVIVGQAALARPDGAAVLASVARVALDAMQSVEGAWNAFNVLHVAAGRVAGLDLGFVPGVNGLDVAGQLKAAASGALKVLYLLAADEIDASELNDTFVVYQGSHGDAGARAADVVLPGSAYTEKSVTFVNTEGRAQMTARAGFAPGEAKEDWAILRALSGHLGEPLPFDTLSALRAAMYEDVPVLAALDAIEPAGLDAVEAAADCAGAMMAEAAFGTAVEDFYLTNAIARSSAVMAEMSALKASLSEGVTGTHG